MHNKQRRHWATRIVLMVLVAGLGACGGSSGGTAGGEPIPPVTQPPSGPSPLDPNTISVLMMGNSHTASVNLPDTLAMVLQALVPEKTIRVERIQQIAFLYQHAQSSEVLSAIDSQTWSHIVLQAQRVSVSHTQVYSTEGAEALIRRAYSNYAQPVLFPEWGIQSDPTDGQYIHNIHKGIAEKSGACVAPVGLAWDWAIGVDPSIALYAPDGNHANVTGTLLAAFVLAESITGESVDLLSTFHTLDVPANVQALLKQAASETVAQYPPCDY